MESKFTGECQIYAGNSLIGKAMLTVYDQGMGVYGGSFMPTSAYSKVRPVFLLFSKAATFRKETGREDDQLIQRFFKARNELGLLARTADGITIPTTAITIIDFTDDLPDDELEIEILVIHP